MLDCWRCGTGRFGLGNASREALLLSEFPEDGEKHLSDSVTNFPSRSRVKFSHRESLFYVSLFFYSVQKNTLGQTHERYSK